MGTVQPRRPMKIAANGFLCATFVVLVTKMLAAQPTAARAASDAKTAPSSASAAQPLPAAAPNPGHPWENSLSMKFVPVSGVDVLLACGT